MSAHGSSSLQPYLQPWPTGQSGDGGHPTIHKPCRCPLEEASKSPSRVLSLILTSARNLHSVCLYLSNLRRRAQALALLFLHFTTAIMHIRLVGCVWMVMVLGAYAIRETGAARREKRGWWENIGHKVQNQAHKWGMYMSRPVPNNGGRPRTFRATADGFRNVGGYVPAVRGSAMPCWRSDRREV